MTELPHENTDAPTDVADDETVARCRVCSCTDNQACDGGCTWVPDPWQFGELCSACLPPDPAAPARLEHAVEQWHETNDRVGEASGNGHPADPYLYAALLDGRAGWWLELGRLRDADPDRPGSTDVYAIACHYAATLDHADAARIRYVHRIPTLHPAALVARLNLQHDHRCEACGRPWQADNDGACEKCPRMLWGVSPASAEQAATYPDGEPWAPADHDREDED